MLADYLTPPAQPAAPDPDDLLCDDPPMDVDQAEAQRDLQKNEDSCRCSRAQ